MVVVQADCKELPLADDSIDLIFTDPPYPKEYLDVYEWLAKEAARVLKPDTFCMAMCGGMYLDKIMVMMSRYLTFHWKFEIYLNGFSATPIWPRQVIARSKPILCYSKGNAKFKQGNVLGAIIGGGQDKRFHHWGQDVESARYYIDVSTNRGDIVCDPFIGGGTTAIACELIERRWVGLDIDSVACRITYDRVANSDMPYRLSIFEL